MFYEFTDKLLKKKWTETQIQDLVGNYRELFRAYATDETLRINAASGGVGSALLIAFLEQNLVDGALVCNTVIKEGKIRAHFSIATNRQEILAAQGSKYVETAFMNEALPLIRQFNGRVAAVGLPCDIANLSRWSEKDHDIGNKVNIKIALVCGHNSRTELIDKISENLEKEASSSLRSYRFRKGHWRGELEAEFLNGTRIRKPFSYFSLYQNLHFFSEKKCLVCNDHFGYHADISLGDIWAYRFKQDPIKKTGVIIRSEQGIDYWNSASRGGTITATALDIDDILDGQARTAPFHYNVSARNRVAPLFGYKIPDHVRADVSWHAWLTALITLFNMRWSESKQWKFLIFKLPRPLLKAYLYLRKGLETLS
ncbi:MAG: Coenzyme F420 hydrogenase/dehydrogenase, beta subunit C-terminal domain [Candidatus Thiodiazotropha sp.]|jgi:coenzyme F420-reducing hydrogenase beta subunit